MTNLRELLAFNIKKYRKIRGFSQEKLAEKAGTSTTHIGMVETAKKFPSVRMLEKIAEAFDIDTPELFTTQTAVFLPKHSKSVEHLYHEIINDFHQFEKTFAGRLKELQQFQNT